MSTENDPTIKEALDASANAIKSGDTLTGMEGLKWVLEREPHNVLAWLWMSRCVEGADEKLICFERVLAIDPTNKHALKGIQMFGGKAKRQESSAVPLKSSAAPPIQDSPLQKILPVLKDRSRAMMERLRPIMERPAAKLALFAVGSLFLIVAIGFACSGIGGGGGSSRSTSGGSAPSAPKTGCHDGIARVEMPLGSSASLWATSDSDDGTKLADIPNGTIVRMWGTCRGSYSNVTALGQEGWMNSGVLKATD